MSGSTDHVLIRSGRRRLRVDYVPMTDLLMGGDSRVRRILFLQAPGITARGADGRRGAVDRVRRDDRRDPGGSREWLGVRRGGVDAGAIPTVTQAFLTNSDFSCMAPMPSMRQSML